MGIARVEEPRRLTAADFARKFNPREGERATVCDTGRQGNVIRVFRSERHDTAYMVLLDGETEAWPYTAEELEC